MDKACQDWLKGFLSKRNNLGSPDGRDIFRYRITRQEFNDLQQLLRDWLGSYSEYENLGHLFRYPLFCKLFVLYGAEWWRRCYEGAGFSWGPIVQELGADSEAWNPQQRSKCIETGLRSWKVGIRQQGALRYILSVALQGGLPMRLLATGKGAIGQISQRVLRLADNSSVNRQDIETWVESLQGRLPHSYRQPAIFILLADIIITILQLKTEANLTSSVDALSQLDKQIPAWRERFSLPLEDRDAQGLVEQLLRDAASLRVEAQKLLFPIERYIESVNGEWDLCSSLPLPATIKAKELNKFFAITNGEMPSLADLSLQVGAQTKSSNLRRMAGHDKYRLKQIPWVVCGENVRRAHLLQLSSPDGRIWFAPAHKGEELDNDLPWIFSASDSHTLLRQGGGKIAEPEVLIALPADWNIQAGQEGECHDHGDMPSFGRKLWNVRGVVRAENKQGDFCRIMTGRADAIEENYFWQGKRVWLDFISPSQAFIGVPQLYKASSEGDQRSVNGAPSFLPINGTSNGSVSGPVTVRYPATGELQHRSRLLLLPENASLSIDCQDPVSGTISLLDWGAISARSLTQDVQVSCRKNNQSLMLDFSLEEACRSPEKVTVEVLWPHSTCPARLTLPFPAKGVRAFGLNGQEWDSGAKITIKKFLGSRLIVHASHHNAHVRINMVSSFDGSSRGYEVCGTPGSLQLVLRLQDYGEDIQHLLAADDNLDSFVRLEIVIEGFEVFHLIISRYGARLIPEKGWARLNNSALQSLDEQFVAQLPIQAINLIKPAEDPISLQLVDAEDTEGQGWTLLPEQREPGPWLLYPAAESSMDLRPLLMTVRGETSPGDILTQAIDLADHRQRPKELVKVVNTLAGDFLHTGWLEVEQLAGQLGHLSLTALDVWRSFVQSSSGMAALAFRLGNFPADFVNRFSRELPFAWETISFAAWRQAMLALQKQCLQMFGEETGAAMAGMQLQKEIEELCNDQNALQYLLGISKALLDPEKNNQEIVGLKFGLGPMAEAELFQGDNCHLQKLLRNHAREQWPTGCDEVLQRAREDETLAKYLCPDSHGFHDPVINLPLLLAVQCVLGQSEEWLQDAGRIRLMRACRVFDHAWFAEAYNLTIARCLADGLFDEFS